MVAGHPRPSGDRAVTEPPLSFDFFFDFSSPFAYLAATQVRALAAETDSRVVLQPFLLGGLFKALGTPNVPLFAMPEAKRRYYLVDLHRWADHYRVPFAFPTRFPMNTVKPLRLCLAAAEAERWPLVEAIFRAFWAEDRDIAATSVLREIASTRVDDADALLAAIERPEIKAALHRQTERALAAGICGAPSFVIGDDVYWGQDRLVLVRRALLDRRPHTSPAPR